MSASPNKYKSASCCGGGGGDYKAETIQISKKNEDT